MTSETAAGRMYVETKNGSTAHADRLPTPPVAKLETARPRAPPNWRETAGNSVPARKQQERPRRIKSVQEARCRPRDNCPVQTKSLPRAVQPQASLAAVDRHAASLAAEGMSMVSNETRNNIGAALARSSQDPVIFIVDDDCRAARVASRSLPRRPPAGRSVRLAHRIVGKQAARCPRAVWCSTSGCRA